MLHIIIRLYWGLLGFIRGYIRGAYIRGCGHSAAIEVGRSFICGHAATRPRSKNFEIDTPAFLCTLNARMCSVESANDLELKQKFDYFLKTKFGHFTAGWHRSKAKITN